MEEKTKFGNGIVFLTTLTPEEYENIGSPLATSVHGFPIKKDNVMFTVNPRGIDIIGGHVELGESNESALIRECMEEGCIVPLKYQMVGAIKIDNRENPEGIEKGYPLIGYQLFYVISEYDEFDFEAKYESIGRRILNKIKIKENHHNWLDVHQRLLDSSFKLMPSTTW